MNVLILNGPNLNLLGQREKEHYGELTLQDIEARLRQAADEMGLSLSFIQSNHEGELIDALHSARNQFDGVLINPGGLTHSSISLRDAITAISLPTVEIHLSNIFARESFRQEMVTTGACAGLVAGFGWRSYLAGLYALKDMLRPSDDS